jgi:hypothetical protein
MGRVLVTPQVWAGADEAAASVSANPRDRRMRWAMRIVDLS